MMFSLAECVSWLAVWFMLSLAIIILNLITIIVFIKNRNLRKRGTHLMINLAVADMLAGVTATYNFVNFGARFCKFWEEVVPAKLTVYFMIIFVLFPVTSVTNITAISLERLHATFLPLRHRVLQKWIYGLIVLITWVTAGLVSIGLGVLEKFREHRYYFFLWHSFDSLCLLIICISYVSIAIKVRCGAQPQHHGAASRERKLTMTLFIVTSVSLLMLLPFVIASFIFFETDAFCSLSEITSLRLNLVCIVLYNANSLVNPILYTMRMPDFRRALVALFRRRPRKLKRAAVIPLRDM